MNIRLIVVGKTKESYWQEAEQEYLDRLKAFMRVEYVVVKARTSEKGQSREAVKRLEGDALLQKVSESDFMIALDEKGNMYSSTDFARILEQWKMQRDDLCFVIGGVFGLSEQVKARAQASLSISPMTLTHIMARTVLLEQIYRAMMILSQRPYHY